MPELPEVETTVRALNQHLKGQKILSVHFRRENLRYPLFPQWISLLEQRKIMSIRRRAKFIIMDLNAQVYALWHLGMSGSLRIDQTTNALRQHDHVEWCFESFSLRYHDPRRFGFLRVYSNTSEMDASFLHYGIEPLSEDFDAEYLFMKSRNRKTPVKNFIMDQSIVVGVGNIYACEALFFAKLFPLKPSLDLTLDNCACLVMEIKKVLRAAIEVGGTTLKDFVNPNAQPGYFAQQLMVYGRKSENCHQCGSGILSIKLSGRSSFYCPLCQTG